MQWSRELRSKRELCSEGAIYIVIESYAVIQICSTRRMQWGRYALHDVCSDGTIGSDTELCSERGMQWYRYAVLEVHNYICSDSISLINGALFSSYAMTVDVDFVHYTSVVYIHPPPVHYVLWLVIRDPIVNSPNGYSCRLMGLVWFIGG